MQDIPTFYEFHRMLLEGKKQHFMVTGTFRPVVVSAEESRFSFAKKSKLNPNAQVYLPSSTK